MGKKQDALRGLIRKFPPPDDVKVILDGLFDEADRSAALVGASLLESALERLLTLNLKVKTPDIRNQLFQVRGPLGDFSAKITVGVGVGFISEAIGIELNIVRTIRN